MTGHPEHCDVPTGEHHETVRPYPCGPRCNTHAPWALKGQPEPEPGPGWPATAWTTPAPTSTHIDQAAIASGKRRSTPEAYRTAQADTRPNREDPSPS